MVGVASAAPGAQTSMVTAMSDEGPRHPRRPDYGIDSPTMVAGIFVAGLAGVGLAAALAVLHVAEALAIVAAVIGAYLVLYAASMVWYSRSGKLAIRDRLLDGIPWRGDEAILDVGCGRGLLLVGAAGRLTAGRATGVDRWVRGAVSGNGPEAALENARLEGVGDRVEVREGDARSLPFPDRSFDVVLSNFVVHELDTRAGREQMLREIARVLRPGGRVALVDFIFTAECAAVLRACGLAGVSRAPIGPAPLLTLGQLRTYAVTGRKPG
jgi:arsenite methyltransferase